MERTPRRRWLGSAHPRRSARSAACRGAGRRSGRRDVRRDGASLGWRPPPAGAARGAAAGPTLSVLAEPLNQTRPKPAGQVTRSDWPDSGDAGDRCAYNGDDCRPRRSAPSSICAARSNNTPCARSASCRRHGATKQMLRPDFREQGTGQLAVGVYDEPMLAARSDSIHTSYSKTQVSGAYETFRSTLLSCHDHNFIQRFSNIALIGDDKLFPLFKNLTSME